ncbi:MAG: hypothetical protein HC821_00810 [Lewinella sp.]|nr:hypothetical protein [Lewinella sp.]
MQEENQDSLRQALTQLPSYPAPASCWAHVVAGLNSAPITPQAGLSLRPWQQYSPPSSVWNRIDRQLTDGLSRYRQRRLVVRWAARAAVALLIFTAGYAYANYQSGPKVTYVFQKENSSPISSYTVADWNNDEASFDRVMEQLENINEPTLNALRLELEELNTAKQEIEEMLRAYGQDQQIINQLATIEIERSRLYRQAIDEL